MPDSQVPEAVEIGEAVIFQSLKDEVVVLNMATQQYFGLDDVGAKMWHLLIEHKNVDAVVAQLQQVYDVDEQRLSADVHALIRDLIAADLLKPLSH